MAAVTGAYGYLGSRIRNALDIAGWSTVALVRRPRAGDHAVAWTLGDPLPAAAADATALVHCAYDMKARRPEDILRINVDGSETLLRSATERGVGRVLVLSSMSAYEGTRQRYGRAKLEIERLTLDVGGIAIRPGLVYGADARGMAGTLATLTALPLTPVVTGGARQFPVLEEDLVKVVVDILGASTWRSEVFGVAQPYPVSFRKVLAGVAAGQGHRCRMIPVPWRLVHAAIGLAERLVPSFPLRSDSLLGLVKPAPFVPSSLAYPHLLESLTVLRDYAANSARGGAS